ncbi:MAG: DUF1844 domain-containing protein [bacterium]|nr:DUF1844 domain-containing protein [bacterium]
MSGERTAADIPLPGGEFRLFITRLSFQGLLSCGVLENPVTGTKDVNAAGAKMILDDLKMLRSKTAGNLDADEAAHLDKVVSDLEHVYSRIQDED